MSALDTEATTEQDTDDTPLPSQRRSRGRRAPEAAAPLAAGHDAWHPNRNTAEQLIRILSKVGHLSGHRPHQIFENWVSIVEATLNELPRHVKAAAASGQLGRDEDDSAATKEVWARCRSRYGKAWPEVAKIFAQAFHMLVEAVHHEWNDILGEIFSRWELSNHWKGQYFTPWNVAYLMAQMINPAETVYERLKLALLHPDNAIGQALLLAGFVFVREHEDEPRPTADEAAELLRPDLAIAPSGRITPLNWPRDISTPLEKYWVEKLIPAALPFYEPVTLHEPCVGSGVMLLAVASTVPWWMNAFGLIQYTGLDIDPLCCVMARTQCMLYGLNGYTGKLIQPLAEADWSAIEARRATTVAPAPTGSVVPSQSTAPGTGVPVNTVSPALTTVATVPTPEQPTRHPPGPAQPRGRATGIRRSRSGFVVDHEQLSLFSED